MSPVVAVSAPLRTDQGRQRVALNAAYARAAVAAGLTPLVVPSLISPDAAALVVAAVGGLMLTGGEDVDPRYYGETRHAHLEDTDGARDAVELALYRAARERRVPILAICRGIQLVNVAEGGTLFQDLPSQHPSSVAHAGTNARHVLRVESGTLLERVAGHPASVNSRHHQAVKSLAGTLRAVAWAEDGVVEGIESKDPGAGWLLGVQWHPEDDVAAGLFEGFADAVARAATGYAAVGLL